VILLASTRRLATTSPLSVKLSYKHGILDFQNEPRLFRTGCPAKKTFLACWQKSPKRPVGLKDSRAS
jgi:hypothetical protein